VRRGAVVDEQALVEALAMLTGGRPEHFVNPDAWSAHLERRPENR